MKIICERRRKKSTTKWKDRGEVLKALKLHYFGAKDEKNQFAEMKKTTWTNVTKAINNLKRRFNIKPQEIGLEEFPIKRGNNMRELVSVKAAEPKPEPEPFKIPTPRPPLEIKKEIKEGDEEEKPKWWNRK